MSKIYGMLFAVASFLLTYPCHSQSFLPCGDKVQSVFTLFKMAKLDFQLGLQYRGGGTIDNKSKVCSYNPLTETYTLDFNSDTGNWVTGHHCTSIQVWSKENESNLQYKIVKESEGYCK